MPQLTSDKEIRAALHQKALRRMHACPHTLVVDELGLAHAKARIDVAVINGCVHGYEIKSATDTLHRLERQLEFYRECLEKLTIVCDEKHVRAVLKLAPKWCGILTAKKGPRGGIKFVTVRRAQRSPHVQPEKLAHLLWRDEVVARLRTHEVSSKMLKQPRAGLYAQLAQLLTVAEITAFIKESMITRPQWRDLPARA